MTNENFSGFLGRLRHARELTDYDFQTVARTLGKLPAAEKSWQDPRGRRCLRGAAFAARAAATGHR